MEGIYLNVLVIVYPCLISAGFRKKLNWNWSIKYFGILAVLQLLYGGIVITVDALLAYRTKFNIGVCYTGSWECLEMEDYHKCCETKPDNNGRYTCHEIDDKELRCQVNELDYTLCLTGLIICNIYNFVFTIPLIICEMILMCRFY